MNMNISLDEDTILLNKYKIIKQLDQGGFSRIYLVENITKNNQQYLLKEFFPNHNIDTEFYQKSLSLFTQEASILSRLRHPQIPKCVDWFEENNNVFIVQEYVKGDNYRQLLYEKKLEQQLFSETEIILFLKDLLIVLDYIHINRIIHRDISPDNIIYSTEINKPVLIDFGGVKEEITEIINNDHPQKIGTMIGKRGYSAPEQLTTGECSQSSDIYALGATALVLLTGKEPEILFSNFSRKKSWIDHVNFSEQLRLILEKMLEEDPENRYDNVKDVLADLEKINPINIDNNITLNNEKTHLIIPLENPTKILGENTIIYENVDQKINKNIIRDTEKKSSTIFIFLSLIILSSITIISLVIQIPHINAICKKLDNCARDKEFQKIFQEILVDGKEVIMDEKEFKKMEDITLQQQNIQEIIKDLKNIPDDVKIYSEAQEELKVYQDKLNIIDKKIDQENQANLEFEELTKDIDNLTKQTSQANTIKENQNLKSQWQQTKTELNKFNPNLLISSSINNQITEVEENITKIDQNIQNLEAKAKVEADKIAKINAQVKINQLPSPSKKIRSKTNTVKSSQTKAKTSSSTNNKTKKIPKKPSQSIPKKNPPSTKKIPVSTPGSVW